ncbi:hypothetical protein C7455_1025 [Roseicyclus mahoneyensis]|uniref:Lipoprotein n=1 Tax=Roseicyclus mahoneyensis TaxID=164332 RepID=A0A316GMZ6_9RHOB|nr:hypothetical protein C7455_1025 [Roseicyclus mahoneyensis]
MPRGVTLTAFTVIALLLFYLLQGCQPFMVPDLDSMRNPLRAG